MFTLRFDMRAPSIGAPPSDLYAAASEMSAWAETRGCVAAVLCEHHCADDGYLPSPLLLGSAIAARTEQLMLNLVIILPFYDVARLAEDMSVLDHISAGRASYVFGIGYRQEEFDHFGLSLSDRGRLADEKLGQLRRLLSGEEVVHDGRRMKVTPPAAYPRRAHDDVGRREPRRGTSCGPQRSGPVGQRRGAGYERGLRESQCGTARLRTGLRADARTGNRHELSLWQRMSTRRGTRSASICCTTHLAYSEWNPDNTVSANITTAKTVDELRASSRTHVILSVDEASKRVADGEVINLSPLCGGMPPEMAWRYLKRFAELG